MRALLLTALLLRICAAELAPAALAAHHAGTVVVADDHAVEVSVAGDVVEAWVVDSTGVPIEASTEPLTITVQLETGPAPVVVVWDATSHSYKGTAPAPVIAGPVEVNVVVAGEARVGRVETIVVVAAPPSTVVVGGAPSVVVEGSRPHVTVEGPRGPDVVIVPPSRPGVVIEAPRGPSVVIAPPSPPGIVIVPPSPPGIVVVPPSPPGVRVHVDDGHHDHGRHIGGGHGGGRGHGGGHGGGRGH